MTAVEYRTNVNLKIDPWLHYFIVCSSFINLGLAVFTFVFQLTHPKSRRNMGRFFLIILALQSLDKINALLQELYIKDLSLPYYELDSQQIELSDETKVCQFMGFLTTFSDYMSQFYALWFAVLIKQVIKDPIHRLQKMICFFHVLTVLIASVLTGILAKFNTFGVQEDLQCGIMFQPGLDDDVLLVIPIFLVPMQMYFISTIHKQTPFIIRQSLKRFVTKYTVYVSMLMSMQCLQVIIVLFGSRNPHYLDYEILDDFKVVRYTYIMLDHLTFLCLVICTIYEPVFLKKTRKFYHTVILRKKNYKRMKYIQPLLLSRANTVMKKADPEDLENEKSCSMAFEQAINQTSQRKTDSDSSDDNFDEGSNQHSQIEMRSEMDVVDKDKFENLIIDYAKFNEKFQHMSVKQKTSYFIINTVLMSICHCLIHANEEEQNEKNKGLGLGLIKAVKSLTYQLVENDIYHIMDVAEFYKRNTDMCVSDLTNGKKVQIKISEYDREIVKKLRKKSGYNDEFFLKSFAPKENHLQMTKFQIGSGKSDSFFFYTANSQFIIKTLKEEELKLLVRKGILEKYYQHIKRNDQSLLARFYGIYTVKIKFMKPISVVIMDNLMGEHITEIQRIYDLKGSLHKRMTKVIKSQRTVRKDLNFLKDDQFYLNLTDQQKQELRKKMYKDKEFLKSCNLMDYSLLLIFFKKSNWTDPDVPNGQQKNMKRSFYMKESPGGNQEIEIEDVPKEIVDNLELLGTPGLNLVPVSSPRGISLVPVNSPRSPSGFLETANFKKDQDVQPIKQDRISIFDFLPVTQHDHEHDSIESDPLSRGSQTQPRVKEFIQLKHPDERQVYYRFGIIDFLQEYNKRKKLETMYLRKRYKKKPANCFSCVEPQIYGDRFYEFMAKNLFTQTRDFPEHEIQNKFNGIDARELTNEIEKQKKKKNKKKWCF